MSSQISILQHKMASRYNSFMMSALLLMLPTTDGCTVDGGEFLKIITVNEELPIGTVIGNISLDNPLEVRKLSLAEANPFIDLVLDDDGRGASFTISKRIDVDAAGLNRFYVMLIDCTTLAGLVLQIEIEFEMLDTNDHFPVFEPTNHYNFSIAETASAGTQIGVITAKDEDIKNSFIQYELVDQDSTLNQNFELITNRNGGAALLLANSLDYETQNLYTLEVIAKDCQVRRDCQHLQKSSTARITVRVKNEDDLNPQFDQPRYQVSLSQNAKNGDLVVQVTAHDQDDVNEAIEYSLSGEGKEYYSMDAVTGKLTVRDKTGISAGKHFTFQTKAVQKSDSSKFDLADLEITIISADWDKPRFTERAYMTSVTEYGAVNSTILSLAINYNLQREPLVVQLLTTTDQSPFRIKHIGNNVELILSKPVDYEEQQMYKVNIRASNGQYEDEIEVTVRVLNENDNNPNFEQESYSFTVLFRKHGIVGTVIAHDADSSEEVIEYRLLPSEVSTLFSINATGCLALTQEKIFYDKDSYTLVVEASDSGKPSRTTNVVVTVTLRDADAAAMKDEKKDSNNNIIGYAIIGSVTLVLAMLTGVIAYLVSRRVHSHNLRKQREELNNSGQAPDDPNFIPLCTERHRDNSSLGLMSVVNGRNENTYRNMSDLSKDEKYGALWKNSNSTLADGCETTALLNQGLCLPGQASTSSDSGHSSGIDSTSPHTHHRSQSDSEATCSRRSHTSSPRGFIGTYLEDHKKRRNSTIPSTLDTGDYPEAPEQFRSRPSSIAESSHSTYAASNTSDYGSTTAPSETNYSSHSTKSRPMVESLLLREHNSSDTDIHEPEKSSNVIIISSPRRNCPSTSDALAESANTKPFTTFHGDLV